jgi:hypothetical protein
LALDCVAQIPLLVHHPVTLVHPVPLVVHHPVPLVMHHPVPLAVHHVPLTMHHHVPLILRKGVLHAGSCLHLQTAPLKSATKIKANYKQVVQFQKLHNCRRKTDTETISFSDPDPGSGAFLTPGSGMGRSQHPDPGSGINNPDHIF